MVTERKQMTGQTNVNSHKLRALPIKLLSLDEQRRIVAYLDSFSLTRDLRQARLASHKGMISLRELQSATGEDPITAIQNAGYNNLTETFLGQFAYSYVFDGQSGYLDHALATSSLAGQVSGVTEWHINCDEPVILEYNTEFKSAGQITNLYGTAPYRSSDHDPVIIGLTLTP